MGPLTEALNPPASKRRPPWTPPFKKETHHGGCEEEAEQKPSRFGRSRQKWRNRRVQQNGAQPAQPFATLGACFYFAKAWAVQTLVFPPFSEKTARLASTVEKVFFTVFCFFSSFEKLSLKKTATAPTATCFLATFTLLFVRPR